MPDNQTIERLRPPKKTTDPWKPYGWLHEQEPDADGVIRKVNTLFLTNKECSFKCVMCDLWKDTLDSPTPKGAIPEQIRFGLGKLPGADVLKFYNNGNFFDIKAIPESDHPEIAKLTAGYETVLVENHPKLCSSAVTEFRNRLDGDLEVAMGLETIHPDVMPQLNKQITKEDFRKAADFLISNEIKTRAFILLNPPFLTVPRENIEWCLKSVMFAFESGIETCSIIPTRAGNGIMDQFLKDGSFVPPTLRALEEVFNEAIELKAGRVFADTWDLEKFSDCTRCFNQRKERLEKMNMAQKVLPPIECEFCNS